jgi:nucleotide-binding universal stress UspA family protein
MFQIKKILFPVDFSEACLGASRYVEAFTGRFQAELTLLHVVDNSAYRVWGTSAYWGMSEATVGEEGIKWAREEMGKFLIEELKHFDVKREVLEGDAGLQIVATARGSGADLIMIPTHSLSVFRRYILGSITARVLHDAECVVWTGTHMENAPPLEAIEFPKVLCAVDLGPQSERALRWAAGFSKEHSAELIVANIVAAWEAGQGRYFDQRFVAEISGRVREELETLLDTLGIMARLIVVGGEPAKAISGIAQSESVNQVIIARGAVAEGFGRLRTQAYAMVRSSPCPVVSV